MGKERPESESLNKLATERLLNAKYGKYDYVEILLGEEYIMQNKPRIIRLYISELLQIPQEKLNYNTFKAWLKNYKKRAAKLDNVSSALKNENKSENNNKDPSDFPPADPGTLDKKREEDYFKNLIKMPYKT